MATPQLSSRGRLAAVFGEFFGVDDPWERAGSRLRQRDLLFVAVMAAFSGLTLS